MPALRLATSFRIAANDTSSLRPLDSSPVVDTSLYVPSARSDFTKLSKRLIFTSSSESESVLIALCCSSTFCSH